VDGEKRVRERTREEEQPQERHGHARRPHCVHLTLSYSAEREVSSEKLRMEWQGGQAVEVSGSHPDD